MVEGVWRYTPPPPCTLPNFSFCFVYDAATKIIGMAQWHEGSRHWFGSGWELPADSYKFYLPVEWPYPPEP